MEVLVKKRLANRVIVVTSALIFIGIGVLNASENINLRDTGKKITMNSSKKISVSERVSRGARIRPNEDIEINKSDRHQIAAISSNIKTNSDAVKNITIYKNKNIAINNSHINSVNNKALTSRGGYGNFTYSSQLYMEATAYTSSYSDTGKNPGDPAFGITASGTRARVGTVAVDPRVIPLGTKLYIKSIDGQKDYGYAVAEDTGGAIKNTKIDLYFNTEDEAIQFGRRQVKVYLLK